MLDGTFVAVTSILGRGGVNVQFKEYRRHCAGEINTEGKEEFSPVSETSFDELMEDDYSFVIQMTVH